MTILRVSDIYFDGYRAYRRGAVRFVLNSINGFSYDFDFGKTFLLDSQSDGMGLTLNWIITGRVMEDRGVIKRDDVYYDKYRREDEVWFIRRSIIKTRRFSFKEPTVQEQIRHGLQRYDNKFFASEQEIMSSFHLTPERFQRPLRLLSTEGWRASCAIGFVNGKNIFYFPYMDAKFIADFYELWFKEMIDVLKNTGSLVLIPTTVTDVTRSLCDDIVTFE